MDDLLREIKKLSATIKDSETPSSKEDATSQPTSAKKTAKKRQKNQHKKNRGRKRRLKYIPDMEVDSSSFTDLTDEDIIRDYIENITADLSDSDVDSRVRSGAFLAKRDLTSTQNLHMTWSPEVDETDSYNESFLLTKNRKKRRRYKRHNGDSPEQPMEHVNQKQREKIHNVIVNQYSRKSRPGNIKKFKLDDEEPEANVIDENMEVVVSHDSLQVNSSSENSDSSTNSRGSDADDEGEESCIEQLPSAITPVIPWWDELNGIACEEDRSEDDKIEQSLSLIKRKKADLKTRLLKNCMPVLCESGGFVAYTNHKIKNFVLHRDSNELSLYTANKKEQSQILQLAALYNLQCSLEEVDRTSKVVLNKTMTTSEANQQTLKQFLSREVKLKCRKNRPPPQWNSKRRKVTSSITDTFSYPNDLMDVPLPESNVGSQMLRTMGWKPGQGLGKDNAGIVNPVKPVKRPRNLGFGHPGVY